MKPHQIPAVCTILRAYNSPSRCGILLADDMGLGKTVIAIRALMNILNAKPEGKVLIVCNKSLVSTWFDEVETFLTDDAQEKVVFLDMMDEQGQVCAFSFRNQNFFFFSFSVFWKFKFCIFGTANNSHLPPTKKNKKIIKLRFFSLENRRSSLFCFFCRKKNSRHWKGPLMTESLCGFQNPWKKFYFSNRGRHISKITNLKKLSFPSKFSFKILVIKIYSWVQKMHQFLSSSWAKNHVLKHKLFPSKDSCSDVSYYFCRFCQRHTKKNILKKGLWSVAVLSNHKFLSLADKLWSNFDYEMVILDECHNYSSPSCKVRKQLLKMQVKCLIGLSGTPCQSDVKQMVFLFMFSESFLKKKFETKHFKNVKETLGFFHILGILTLLSPILRETDPLWFDGIRGQELKNDPQLLQIIQRIISYMTIRRVKSKVVTLKNKSMHLVKVKPTEQFYTLMDLITRCLTEINSYAAGRQLCTSLSLIDDLECDPNLPNKIATRMIEEKVEMDGLELSGMDETAGEELIDLDFFFVSFLCWTLWFNETISGNATKKKIPIFSTHCRHQRYHQKLRVRWQFWKDLKSKKSKPSCFTNTKGQEICWFKL